MFRSSKPKYVKVLNFKMPRMVFYSTTGMSAFGIVCLLKEWSGGQTFRRDIMANDKVAIVTGANSGIGKEVVRNLARRKAKVYMACRDLQSCEEAREEIVLETKNKYIYCRKCDLASMESIQEFVKLFKKEEKRLDILINNAGVMRTPYSKTRDGFEMQLGVNHFGHFLLTHLVLDLLKESAPSRIVNVSSIAHKRGKIQKDDLNSEQNYDPADAYSQSKLANILFTKELAKKLQGTGVTVNAVHPGIVDTNIVRHMSFANSFLAKYLVYPLVWPFIKSPKQASDSVVYVALSETLNGVTGKYFSNCKENDVGENAKDEVMAEWLWKVSEKWTRLAN